jgi:hypothetical protein
MKKKEKQLYWETDPAEWIYRPLQPTGITLDHGKPVKELSGKLSYLRFEFFSATRSPKMTPHEGHSFFDFI